MAENIRKNDILSVEDVKAAGLEYTFQNFADLRIYKKDEMRFLLEPNEAGFRVWLWDINSR